MARPKFSREELCSRLNLPDEELPTDVPYINHGRTGLRLPERLSSLEIRQILYAAYIFEDRGFTLGDILLWVEEHEHAGSELTYDELLGFVHKIWADQTIRNHRSCSRKWPIASRRSGISWAFHDTTKTLPQLSRDRLLDTAKAQGWDVRRLHEEVGKLTGKLHHQPLKALHREMEVTTGELIKLLAHNGPPPKLHKILDELAREITELGRIASRKPRRPTASERR